MLTLSMATACVPGVYECGFAAEFVFTPEHVNTSSSTCAAYDGTLTDPSHLRGLVVAGFVVMMVRALCTLVL